MPRPRSDFVILCAAVGIAVAVAITAATSISYVAANRWVDHTLEVDQEADEWLIAVLDTQTGLRGFVLSGTPIFLAPYESAISRERARAAHLKELVQDNPTQAANVDTTDHDALRMMAFFAEVLALAKTAPHDEVLRLIATGEGQRRMDAFRADIDRIRADETRLLAERRAVANSRALYAFGGVLVIGLAAFGSVFYAWTVQRRRANLVDRLAEEARERLEALSAVASALAAARTRAQVADAVVEHAFAAAKADTCTLYLLNDTGTLLELIGERGVSPQIMEKIRSITETAGNPDLFASMKSGRATWVESAAEYTARLPVLAAAPAKGPRAKSFWSVPLIVEGLPIGLLGMGYYAERAFPEDERRFIETLAGQCAQALLRATRLEREDQARRLLATTLRSVGDAVIATDTEGAVVFMNAVAERLTGWTSDDARGRPLEEAFQIYSEETREVVESPVKKVLRDGVVVGLANHTVLRAKDGTEVPIDDSAAPIRDEGDRLLGVVLVFRDVTAKKREQAQRDFLAKAGEALVASLDYRTTLAAVGRLVVPELADWCSIELVEPGYATPLQVAVAHVDPAKVEFARALGERYPPDRDAKTGVPEVIRTGKSELYREIPSALLEAAAKDAEHLRLIRELELASAMVVPLRAHGRVLGAMTFVYAESGRRYDENDLLFAEDVARRAAMAIENAQVLRAVDEARVQEGVLRDRAEVASRAKDEFLATVSHELRTPLNAILGWTITLRATKPEADVDRHLAIIERNARAQAKLIEDVLDVSRIISGKLTMRLRPTSVVDAVIASIETVSPAATAKGITITRDLRDDGVTISADPDRMQQVVWNLLANAVKFTPQGGKVQVAAYREGSDISIRVTDDGEGIAPEAMPRIFETFHQADSTTTRRHGGLGLGLSIVRRIVAAHGGTVSAKSEGVGKGSTFLVLLPARFTAVAARPANAGVETGAVGPRLDGLRVLVIDDEEDARALLAALLRERGAEVRLASSGREALDELPRLKPDVVVSDIGMPEMDGYSLIQQIRARAPAQGGRTPALALTAYARPEDVERALAAGFQHHMAKPIEPAELVKAVAELGSQPASTPT